MKPVSTKWYKDYCKECFTSSYIGSKASTNKHIFDNFYKTNWFIYLSVDSVFYSIAIPFLTEWTILPKEVLEQGNWVRYKTKREVMPWSKHIRRRYLSIVDTGMCEATSEGDCQPFLYLLAAFYWITPAFSEMSTPPALPFSYFLYLLAGFNFFLDTISISVSSMVMTRTMTKYLT